MSHSNWDRSSSKPTLADLAAKSHSANASTNPFQPTFPVANNVWGSDWGRNFNDNLANAFSGFNAGFTKPTKHTKSVKPAKHAKVAGCSSPKPIKRDCFSCGPCEPCRFEPIVCEPCKPCKFEPIVCPPCTPCFDTPVCSPCVIEPCRFEPIQINISAPFANCGITPPVINCGAARKAAKRVVDKPAKAACCASCAGKN